MLKNFILSVLFLGCSSKSYSYPVSDHFDGVKFFNPEEKRERSFFDVLKWKFSAKPEKWPEHVANVDHPFLTYQSDAKALVTFINHATYLLQLEGVTILTDPVFSERVSPVSFAGPKRVREAGLSFEKLPPIDAVIISHNHYDHLDLASLKKLDERFHPVFIVPLGNKKLLQSEGIANVTEIDWWEDFQVKSAKITLTPCLHWSARTLWDKYEALWGSFFIQHPKLSLYFAGDTGYSQHFVKTRERLGAPDFAILPIGAYEPRWFMDLHHMNPDEAVKAHLDLGAKVSVPMHFGTFQLTDEGIDKPLRDLELARKVHQVSKEAFRILDQGESYKF